MGLGRTGEFWEELRGGHANGARACGVPCLHPSHDASSRCSQGEGSRCLALRALSSGKGESIVIPWGVVAGAGQQSHRARQDSIEFT